MTVENRCTILKEDAVAYLAFFIVFLAIPCRFSVVGSLFFIDASVVGYQINCHVWQKELQGFVLMGLLHPHAC